MEKNCPGCQWVKEMLAAIAPRIEEPPAIVIPELGRRAGAPEQAQSGQHPLQRILQTLWNRNIICACQNGGVKKKIERIHVIIGRLLEVEAVCLNLPVRLSYDNLPAQRLPAFGLNQLWA